jgi:hypothetical protein
MYISEIWHVLNKGNETILAPENTEVLTETIDTLKTLEQYIKESFYEESLAFRKTQINFIIAHIEKLYKVTARIYDTNTELLEKEKDSLQKILFQLDVLWENTLFEKERLEKLPPEKEAVIITEELKTFDSSAN